MIVLRHRDLPVRRPNVGRKLLIYGGQTTRGTSGCLNGPHVITFGASRRTSREPKRISRTLEEARESHDMRRGRDEITLGL